jgi:uncharacterized membrane protein YcaP (DUF421 family)
MHIPWNDMFAMQLPMMEKILRPICVYIFLLVGLRLAGKRELAQLNPFDLIVLLTLSNTVQNAIIGNDNSITGGLVGAATLLLVNYLLVRFVHRHKRLEKLVEGSRDFLMRDGHVLQKHMNRELMSRAELVAAAHRQGIGSLAEVDSCVLEPTGTITFVQKTPSTDDLRHHELLDAIDVLRKELIELRGHKHAGDTGKWFDIRVEISGVADLHWNDVFFGAIGRMAHFGGDLLLKPGEIDPRRDNQQWTVGEKRELGNRDIPKKAVPIFMHIPARENVRFIGLFENRHGCLGRQVMELLENKLPNGEVPFHFMAWWNQQRGGAGQTNDD